MIRAEMLLLAVFLACFYVLTVLCQSPAVNLFKGSGDVDAVEELKSLSEMPEYERNLYLGVIGGALEEEYGLPCNIFGGESSCQKLPKSSQLAQSCPTTQDLRVDCAYYSNSKAELSNNPKEQFMAYMREHGESGDESLCEECFDNLQALWCAQTIATCGSFQRHVVKVLLPSMVKVLEADRKGDDQVGALAEAVPDVVRAMSYGMACREMCHSVMSTCLCGQQAEQTFGTLLQELLNSRGEAADADAIPPGLSEKLFGKIWAVPVCDLYAPSADPQFEGTCTELPGSCSQESGWCSSTLGQQRLFVQQLIALQLARSVFSFVQNPQYGLYPQLIAIEDADPESKEQGASILTAERFAEDTKGLQLPHATPDAGGAPRRRRSRSVCATVLVLGSISVVAGAAWAAVRWYRRRAPLGGYTAVEEQGFTGFDDAGAA